jgi:rhamnose transport system permease protein
MAGVSPIPSTVTKYRRPIKWDVAILGVLVVVAVTSSIIDPNFNTAFNISFLIANLTEILIIAMPMTLLIISGEIDLSVASVMGLAGAVFGVAYRDGVPIWGALAIALLAGFLCGLVNGLLVAKLGLGSLAVTIATLALYRGFATALLGTESVSSFPREWTRFAFGTYGDTFIPRSFPLLIAVVAAFWVLVHYTVFGRRVYGIGLNVEAARFAAVPVDRYKVILFILTGTMAGLAGVLYALRFSTAQYDNAVGLELSVIATVLLGGVSIFGGIGAIWGVVAAAFLLSSIRSVLLLQGFTPNVFIVVQGLLLILAVVIPVLLIRWHKFREHRRHGGSTQLPPGLQEDGSLVRTP